jgi:hypothetical protein
MEKLNDFITVRIPPALKHDYDKLDQMGKKRAKIAILNALSRVCFAEIHYDPSVHFGADYKVEEDE